MLDQIYNSCYDVANSVSNWQNLSKNEIANLYFDNRDSESGNIYAAALLCKYWYKVGLLWKNNSLALTQEDCYAIVWEGIERAMFYAPWKNPDSNLYNDPNGPDKAINVCIDSVRKNLYVFSSRDKRKLNHKSNTVSLDGLYSLVGDHSNKLRDDFDIEGESNIESDVNIAIYIENLITEHRYPEAIIIDNICYGNVISRSNDGTSYFSRKKLRAILYSLDSTFIDNFARTYGAKEDETLDCLSEMRKLNKYRLTKLVNKTIYLIAKEWGIKYVS